MNEPRRLRKSGGTVERLLDSASIDKPSRASRHRAIELASTAGAFSSPSTGIAPSAVRSSPPLFKSVAKWGGIGAAVGLAFALVASQVLESPLIAGNSASSGSATPLVMAETLAPGGRHLEIARQALSRGDHRAALQALDEYDAQHPNGSTNAAEAATLRVQAVSASGDIAKARQLASAFEERYPQHPLSGTVRNAVKAPTKSP